MRKSPWFMLAAIAAGSVLALGLIVAMDFLTRSGGARPEAVGTQAPDTHPAAASTGGPDLHFTTTSVDLGVVPLGTEVGYAFSYANIGAKTLQIEDVNVRAVRGCWPFQPVVGATTLEPGEKSKLSFKTHMMAGMDGPHLFEITVKSNDADHPVVVLDVKGDFEAVGAGSNTGGQ